MSGIRSSTVALLTGMLQTRGWTLFFSWQRAEAAVRSKGPCVHSRLRVRVRAATECFSPVQYIPIFIFVMLVRQAPAHRRPSGRGLGASALALGDGAVLSSGLSDGSALWIDGCVSCNIASEGAGRGLQGMQSDHTQLWLTSPRRFLLLSHFRSRKVFLVRKNPPSPNASVQGLHIWLQFCTNSCLRQQLCPFPARVLFLLHPAGVSSGDVSRGPGHSTRWSETILAREKVPEQPGQGEALG